MCRRNRILNNTFFGVARISVALWSPLALLDILLYMMYNIFIIYLFIHYLLI